MVVFISTVSSPDRPNKLAQFYRKLGVLKTQTGGPFYLSDVDGTMDWPHRGIYIFFDESTDPEIDPVSEWHITRIGTVGVSKGSSSSLWQRLRTHRGTTSGNYADGGNCRGSVFRLHIGNAIIEDEGLEDKYPHWGVPHRQLPDNISTSEIRAQEHPLELRVSERIRNLPFLVIDIPGKPHADCDRARLEKNLIALVSHARRTNPHLKKDDWLGHHSPRAEINKTGLWNLDHVNSFYTDSIISEVTPYIESTSPISETDSEGQ